MFSIFEGECFDDAARIAGNDGVGRERTFHDGSRSDDRSAADRGAFEHDGSCSQEDIIFEFDGLCGGGEIGSPVAIFVHEMKIRVDDHGTAAGQTTITDGDLAGGNNGRRTEAASFSNDDVCMR